MDAAYLYTMNIGAIPCHDSFPKIRKRAAVAGKPQRLNCWVRKADIDEADEQTWIYVSNKRRFK
jgi:hypothetical protein